MKCMKHIAIAFISVLALTSASYAEFNGKPCQCRSKEGKVDEGTVMCMSTSSGERLMRCEMVLNNTAWVPIANGCAVGSVTFDEIVQPAG